MLIVLVSLIGLLSILAYATPVPPSQPTPTPKASSGGGGSASSSSYTAPVFQTYTIPLKTSDGTVIGHFDGKNYNSVLVFAEKNGTVGNATYDLTVNGELSSKPDDNSWLNINFQGAGSAAVPPGMENGQVLGVLNITKNPGDWGYKNGPKYILTITGSGVTVNSGDQYYLVRYDGTNYQVQKIDISVSGNQSAITFNPPGDTGIFTLMRAPMATPTPTPTPTPLPTATPTPTPLPSGSMWTYPMFVVLFVIGVLVGAAALYLLNIHR